MEILDGEEAFFGTYERPERVDEFFFGGKRKQSCGRLIRRDERDINEDEAEGAVFAPG